MVVPSLEGWSTKMMKEAPSPRELRLTPLVMVSWFISTYNEL